jgi:sugar lactone lactonase YvrE
LRSDDGEYMRTLTQLVEWLALPEAPRWRDGKLFFADMHMNAVLVADTDGNVEKICHVPNRPSGLGWLPDGRMLVVSMADRKLMRLEANGLKVHADLSNLASGDCNDMTVDAHGRAYIGNFGFDFFANAPRQPAELVMVTPDGSASIVARDLDFPNGMAITPDGKTLIVGETLGQRLTAFDIASDGTLDHRRLWADIAPHSPDGIALDAEGAIWVASPFTNQVIRVLEGGRVVERIETGQMCLACAFGGEGRKTLFILTSPTVDPEQSRTLLQSRILTARVEVPGTG